MKKFLIFFFIFSLSTSIFQPLFSKNKNLKDSLGCTNDLSKDFFLLGDNLPIKKIEIDTHKYRDSLCNFPEKVEMVENEKINSTQNNLFFA